MPSWHSSTEAHRGTAWFGWSDRVNEPESPARCDAVHDGPPSGRRRCSTSPGGHPENHRCATVCRTADRHSGGRFPRQAQDVDRTARAALPAGRRPASGRSSPDRSAPDPEPTCRTARRVARPAPAAPPISAMSP